MNHKSFLPVFRLFGPWATSSSFCFPGKLFYLCFPAHRLFLRLERLIPHQPHRPPRFRIFCAAPGIVRVHPLSDHSSIRGKAFRPNTPEDMCSSSAVLSFSGSGTQALLPAHRSTIFRCFAFRLFTYYVNGNGTMSITVLESQRLRNLYESIRMPCSVVILLFYAASSERFRKLRKHFLFPACAKIRYNTRALHAPIL